MAALVLAGCSGGSGGSEPSGEGDDGRDARSSGSSGSEDAGAETAALGTPSLGSADAPVVMTEYSDFQ